VAALLVAEACNARLTPVTDPAPPAGGCRLVDTAIDLAGLFEGECWVVEDMAICVIALPS
jgi:hypothetical protein